MKKSKTDLARTRLITKAIDMKKHDLFHATIIAVVLLVSCWLAHSAEPTISVGLNTNTTAAAIAPVVKEARAILDINSSWWETQTNISAALDLVLKSVTVAPVYTYAFSDKTVVSGSAAVCWEALVWRPEDDITIYLGPALIIGGAQYTVTRTEAGGFKLEKKDDGMFMAMELGLVTEFAPINCVDTWFHKLPLIGKLPFHAKAVYVGAGGIVWMSTGNEMVPLASVGAKLSF